LRLTFHHFHPQRPEIAISVLKASKSLEKRGSQQGRYLSRWEQTDDVLNQAMLRLHRAQEDFAQRAGGPGRRKSLLEAARRVLDEAHTANRRNVVTAVEGLIERIQRDSSLRDEPSP
jgi:hypothetical protein